MGAAKRLIPHMENYQTYIITLLEIRLLVNGNITVHINEPDNIIQTHK